MRTKAIGTTMRQGEAKFGEPYRMYRIALGRRLDDVIGGPARLGKMAKDSIAYAALRIMEVAGWEGKRSITETTVDDHYHFRWLPATWTDLQVYWAATDPLGFLVYQASHPEGSPVAGEWHIDENILRHAGLIE